MKVTFTKAGVKRYEVAIERENGPALVPRFAPGYDDLMPHDLAHYLVEEYFEIELGVWGQLAAGGGGIFWPAPSDNSMRYQRRAARIGAIGRVDMQRSEHLVVTTVAAWERTVGRTKHQSFTHGAEVDAETLRGAVRRMAEVADQWRDLRLGGSLVFVWPKELTLDAAKSRRGRRRRSLEPAHG